MPENSGGAPGFEVQPLALLRAAEDCRDVAETFGRIVELCRSHPLPAHGAPPVVTFLTTVIGWVAQQFVEKGTQGQQQFGSLADRFSEVASRYTDIDHVAGDAFGRLPDVASDVFRGATTAPPATPSSAVTSVAAPPPPVQPTAAVAAPLDAARLRRQAQRLDKVADRDIGRPLEREPLLQSARDRRLELADARLERPLEGRYHALEERIARQREQLSTAGNDQARLATLQHQGDEIRDEYQDLREDVGRAKRAVSAGLVGEVAAARS